MAYCPWNSGIARNCLEHDSESVNPGSRYLGQLASGATLAVGLVLFSIYSRDRVTVDEVRMIIDGDLSIGGSAQEIESVFNRNGIIFTFSPTQDRYQSIIRDISPYSFIDKSISIYVYTDSEKSFVRAEVFQSYTFL